RPPPRESDRGEGRFRESRRDLILAGAALCDRTLAAADTLRRGAGQSAHSPAQVALAWTLAQPGITAPVLGARTLAQLEDNLGALTVHLDADQLRLLAEASAPTPGYPHNALARPMAQRSLFGDMSIRPRTHH
ncbi:aldo/keto reductase, partial [Nocardia cyriacigeorgica]|uniref:aldo/keto reductase n=1 Tax=Nocardia cyriacigeorgica TaxID=135487 RepID=UPI002458F229